MQVGKESEKASSIIPDSLSRFNDVSLLEALVSVQCNVPFTLMHQTGNQYTIQVYYNKQYLYVHCPAPFTNNRLLSLFGM